MSTPGKVLVAVVILGLVAWIFLLSQIAQLNINWGKRIDELTEQVQSMEEGIAQTRQAIDATLRETTLSQEKRAKDLTVLHARLSDAEKLQATNQEALVRVEQQIQLLNQSLEAATTAVNNRNTEGAATEQQLAESRAEVEQLKDAVSRQFETLGALRQQFKDTHEENATLLQALRTGGSATEGARTRPALLSR